MFDGVCNFCNFWVNFIIKRDEKDRFRFASLQSAVGQELLDKFGLSKTDFDTFILIDSESYYTKSTAALKIAKNLSGPLKVTSVFIFLPRIFRDFLYSLIARNRYKLFGKRDACRIPDEKDRMKFL